MKIPDPNTLDVPQKFVTIVNLIVFLVVFVGLYLIARHFVHNIFLRILCLVVDYFITSMLVYCIIRPLSDKAVASMRNMKKSR